MIARVLAGLLILLWPVILAGVLIVRHAAPWYVLFMLGMFTYLWVRWLLDLAVKRKERGA